MATFPTGTPRLQGFCRSLVRSTSYFSVSLVEKGTTCRRSVDLIGACWVRTMYGGAPASPAMHKPTTAYNLMAFTVIQRISRLGSVSHGRGRSRQRIIFFGRMTE